MSIRTLDIPASQWRDPDIATVRSVLAEAGDDPEQARAWRGSVVLNFAEAPGFNLYLNPEIAAFLQELYAEIPHLLYFLNPDRTIGALDGFFASIGVLYENQFGAWVLWSDDVANAFYEALADAAEFAINQGDDWVDVVKGYEYDERQTRFKEIRAILLTRGVIEP